MSEYQIRADEVIIKKEGGAAELRLLNSTKDVLGYLCNLGDGLTEFREVAPGAAEWGAVSGTLADQTDLVTALGLRQPLDSDLTAIAALSAANNDIIQRKSGAWTNRTINQYKTDLVLDLVENTALSTWPGSTNITTLGTIVAGVWNAQAIAINKGGVPPGGTTGQVLKKLSNTDYDYSWGTDNDTGGGGGISDGNKGDVTVSGSGTIWGVNNSAINTIKIADAAITNVKVATGIDAIKLADGSVTNTEFQYINSLTSNAQSQIDGKQPTISLGTTAQYFRGDLSLATFPTISGSNTGDASLAGQNYLTIVGQVITANAVNLSGTHVTGTLSAARIAGTATDGFVATLVAGVPTWQAPSGGGSGTVNTGAANRLAYYSSAGTAVVNLAAITASRALVSDTNGLPVAATTTTTELNYVNGVTSSIQTQLDAKQWIVAACTTGGSASANTTAIHAAITAAAAVGKRVLILAGTYNVNPITLNPAVPMDGVGMYKTILVAGASGDLFSYTSTTRVPFTEITNMMLDGNSTGTNAINLHSSSQVKLTDLFISGFTGIGINFKGVLISEVTRCIIQIVATGIKGEADATNANLANLMTFNAIKFYDITGWGVDWNEGATIKFNDCDWERCGDINNNTGGAIWGHGLSASGPGANSEGIDIVINGGWAELNYGEAVIKLQDNNGTTSVRDFLIQQYGGNTLYGIINDNSKLYLDNVKISNFPTNSVLTENGGSTVASFVSDIFEHTEATGGTYVQLGNGGGGSGDMTKNAANTMGASGTILFPASTTASAFRIGTLEFQSQVANTSHIGENISFDGTNYIHRATGAGGLLYFGTKSIAFFSATSASAGATATLVSAWQINSDGNMLQAASTYHNWGTTAGTTGYGLRDNAGTMEFKNSGGSWAALGSGGGGGSNWTVSGSDVYRNSKVSIGAATAPSHLLHLFASDAFPSLVLEKTGTHSADTTYSLWAKSALGITQIGIDSFFNPSGAGFISTTAAGGLIFSGDNSSQDFNVFANGTVRIANLGGNGPGVVAVDNDGDLTWMATPSGGSGDMIKNSTNTMGASGKIVFPASGTNGPGFSSGGFSISTAVERETWITNNIAYVAGVPEYAAGSSASRVIMDNTSGDNLFSVQLFPVAAAADALSTISAELLITPSLFSINFGASEFSVTSAGRIVLGTYDTLTTYADEAAALAGGLAQNTLYKTATGELRIKL